MEFLEIFTTSYRDSTIIPQVIKRLKRVLETTDEVAGLKIGDFEVMFMLQDDRSVYYKGGAKYCATVSSREYVSFACDTDHNRSKTTKW